MEFHIKNMVCDRCIAAVQSVFEQAGFRDASVALGLVTVQEAMDQESVRNIDRALEQLGFERVTDPDESLVEEVKAFLIKIIQQGNLGELKETWSTLLAQELGRDYADISSRFSQNNNLTIEHFIITQKVEKAKELLALGEMNASEIAYFLGYSSAAHFSNQFKKATGFTPVQFSKSPERFALRKKLDQIM